jgi:hypothetical protein
VRRRLVPRLLRPRRAGDGRVSRPPRIVLVGFMGRGKSTVGPEVARALASGFLDLDRALERRLGQSVPEIFRRAARRLPRRGAAPRREALGPGAPRAAPRAGVRSPRTRRGTRSARAPSRSGCAAGWMRCSPAFLRTEVDRSPWIVRQSQNCSPSGSPPTARPTGGGRRAVAGFRRAGRGPAYLTLPASRARTRPRRATVRAPFGAVRRTSERCGT